MKTQDSQLTGPRQRSVKGIALAVGLTLAFGASAQEPPAEEKPKPLEQLIVTGSRAVGGRTAGETLAPVDVLGRVELEASGALELGQVLQMLQPSFNFSRTFISDGTDIIRPATLRALGPDQVLVLVNGKRRHQQALVNVQQTVGRGSAGTDINAIPISAIERIEVLRDGAAAQYGSDAIAGVINVVLKQRPGETAVQFESGQTYDGDGEVLHGGINTGFAIGDEGFVNLTGEYRDRGETNRAGVDVLRVDPPRVTQRIGDADAEDLYFWLNAGVPIGNGALYGFGGISRREGDSSGFFRSAGDNRTVPALYPDGFLPNIITTVRDASLALGYRAPLGALWEWDLSVNHGVSKFEFEERNSVNVTWWFEPQDPADPLGPRFEESPTEADTGALRFSQTTANLDFRGDIDWGLGTGPLHLATGLEWRKDRYEILAGDPVSYTYGRTNDRSIEILGQTGEIAQPGIQGFPGFSPNEAIDDDRHNVAAYVDAEAQLGSLFVLGAALRYEDYSDFGSTVTGKLSARFDPTEHVGIRSTVSTGFRAPSVQQAFYSQRSTNLNPEGVLTDTLTARQDSDVTRAFGIAPLKEEESVSASIGVVLRPTDTFTITVDVFRIDIDDRIIFSSNIVPEAADTCLPDNSNCPIRAILDPIGVGQVLFFTNAIDTRTTGIDVVAEHRTDFAGGSILHLTALVHFNETEVRERRSQSAILPSAALFDDTQVTLVEEGQPGSQHVLQAAYHIGDWNLVGRANYYGSVTGEGFTPGLKQKWSGDWLFDLSLGYSFTDSLSLTVGANNIFDTTPDRWTAGVTDPTDPDLNNPFPALGFTYCWETCPFGVNGGYYYGRLNFHF